MNQAWCSIYKKKAALRQLETDTHSYPKYRWVSCLVWSQACVTPNFNLIVHTWGSRSDTTRIKGFTLGLKEWHRLSKVGKLDFGEDIENMYIWNGEGWKITLFGLKKTDNLIGHGLYNPLFKWNTWFHASSTWEIGSFSELPFGGVFPAYQLFESEHQKRFHHSDRMKRSWRVKKKTEQNFINASILCLCLCKIGNLSHKLIQSKFKCRI